MKKYAKGHFNVKDEGTGKSIIIEGYANRAVADRINEVIPPDAWELDNYAKNPIIFFNHDRNAPIGKAIDFKVDDDGLKIKVRLSRSNEHPVPYVRDLVEEGILQTFSVGFDDHDTAEKSNDGSVQFKRAELLETSIVTIPMNQDSTFQVVGSGAKEGPKVYKVKQAHTGKEVDYSQISYEQIKEDALCMKGAWVAAAVHNGMYHAQKNGRKREELVSSLVNEGDLDPDFVKDILAGEVTPVPEAFIDAAAKVLEIDRESLVRLNQGDMQVEEQDDEEDQPEEPEAEEQQSEQDEPEDKEDDEPEEDKEKAIKDFQECVATKIPKLIEEGKERDQAVAVAISMCQDEKECKIRPSEDAYKLFLEIADANFKAEKMEEEEEEEEKTDKPEDEEEPKEKQAEQDKVEGPTTELVEDAGDDTVDIGNPTIEFQKTQIALAGEQINLLRALLKEMTELRSFMQDQTPPVEAEVEVEDDADLEEDFARMDQKKEATLLDKIEKDFDEIDSLQKRYRELMNFSY